MATHLSGPKWTELKKDLMQKWHELTENDLEQTKGRSESIADLLERKVGLAIEEASEKVAEIASHYHLYDEPEEKPAKVSQEKKERVMELKPKKPARRDVNPKA
ncbi:transcriptional regulator [Bdellovibrio sp. 22V]|uniref:transcriptional regulator n=1 Tax=Bdellovibrio TaxID=958 RepID=UPI0025437405|nr:transcriptional regulator [Bdellovibrio sp. 22V]WII73647.1 transcriptional regulator [Bdellovibrio sp. 22V]